MIEVEYKKDASGDQNVEVTSIHVKNWKKNLISLDFLMLTGDSLQLHLGWVCLLPSRDWQLLCTWQQNEIRVEVWRAWGKSFLMFQVSTNSVPYVFFPSKVTEAVNKMSIFLKIEEPDIFLVENLEDVNSDALMFNTELQYVVKSKIYSFIYGHSTSNILHFRLKMLAVGTNFSIWAKLENIRCHTCRLFKWEDGYLLSGF